MSRGYPLVTPALAVDAQVIDASWRTFGPQILNTGAGATPTYVTNSGRFMVANNVCRCDLLLDGDGGTPGSGAGVLAVSLPAMPSALRLAGYTQVGYYGNNANQSVLFATLLSSSVFATLSHLITTGAGSPNISDLTGADQNNATRTIRLHFWYECDLLPP